MPERLDAGLDEDLVLACPECDSSDLKIRGNQQPSGNERDDYDPEMRYRCQGCGSQFDAAKERPARSTTITRHGLAGALADPEVSAVSDLDEDELVTDGGEDLRVACPECDRIDPRPIVGTGHGHGEPEDYDYRCRHCKALWHEGEGNRRLPKRDKGPNKGIAAALADPDVESVADLDREDLATDGGLETVVIEDEWVIKHAVPREEAVTYVHVGLDPAYHPFGGYWFPSDIEPDGEMSGWVRRESELTSDDLIQYPCNDRPPRVPRRNSVPAGVKNRIVDHTGELATDGGGGRLEQACRGCGYLASNCECGDHDEIGGDRND